MMSLLELLIAIIGSILTAYATYDIWKRKRIEDFLADYRSLSYNRSMYSDNMRRAYIKDDKSHLCRRLENEAFLIKPISADGSLWDAPGPISCISLNLDADTNKEDSHVSKDGPGELAQTYRSMSGVPFLSYGKLRFVAYRIMELPNPFKLYSYNSRRYAEKKVFNGKLLRITRVERKRDGIDIHIGLSDYYSYYNTCEMLSFLSVSRQNHILEGRWWRWEKNDKSLDRTTKKLLIDPFDFNGRCVGIGVCTLTVLYNVNYGREKYFLIHHRSNTVSEAMNTISLVPAGALQANNGGNDIGKDLRLNIVREFEEEVLGHEEVEFTDKYDSPVGWIPETRNIDADTRDEKNNRMSEEAYKKIHGIDIHYLTMGMDPLTTKMEMITMLTIDCSSTDVFDYLHRMVPNYQGPLRCESIDGILSSRASSEGRITRETFDLPTVTRYSNYSEGMPVFRECMRYVTKHWSDVTKLIENRTDDEQSESNQ